ncbi:hypothetical protein Q8G81_33240, partial [Klebsiella pneumoniae]
GARAGGIPKAWGLIKAFVSLSYLLPKLAWSLFSPQPFRQQFGDSVRGLGTCASFGSIFRFAGISFRPAYLEEFLL